ncbi:MFS transporter, partial [bacterium]|nr:MFS transporter [bacterium]
MRRFLFKVYGFKLLEDFIPVYPIYIVMFTDHGLSPMDIALTFTAWSLSLILLELPSGVLADRYSRRKVMLFGMSLQILAMVTWMFYKTFWGF